MKLEERKAMGGIAVTNAKNILKKGDRVRVTKCPGTKRTITFERWDGCWMVSKSGLDEYHPINVDKVNSILVDFTSEKGYSLLVKTQLKKMAKQDIDEEVCNYCEEMILGCCHSSSTFLCEGCSCEEALESFNEFHDDE